MVGIVIVSHSRPLARSVAELASTVSGETSIPIAYAGGVSGGDEGFGTDATDILAAIESVISDDGVVVLMDMGSALLSAEMALELSSAEGADVRLIAAPLVEGAIVAATQSGAGADLDAVVEEARTALGPKQLQLGESPESTPADEGAAGDRDSAPTAVSVESSTSEDQVRKVFVIRNTHGLHARPAARLVKTVSGFDADVTVSNLSNARGPVAARSLNRLSSLEITRDDEVLVSATGADARNVLDAVAALVADNFGESLTDVAQERANTSRKHPDGTVALSPGFGIGEVVRIDAISLDVEYASTDDIDGEIATFREAVQYVRSDIAERLAALSAAGNAEREIFEAHDVLLDDPDLIGATIDLIRAQGVTASHAFSTRVRAVVDTYVRLDDAYLQVRAADVRDIGRQVLQKLGVERGAHKRIDALESDTIIVAEELTPSQTVSLDLNRVVGIVTKGGGTTSHTAILARSLGIAAVGGYPAIDAIDEGAIVAVDGFEGVVTVNPDDEAADSIRSRRRTWLEERERLRIAAARDGSTSDGVPIPVEANVSSASEMEVVRASGAQGIGLLRTEFLYLNREAPPSVEEQCDYFSAVFDGLAGRPITVRTFDIGGDKRIPYMELEDEENPFLGVRGIRLYEHNPRLFEQHLEAILISAAGHDVRIMFPMVTKVGEFRSAVVAAERIHEALLASGRSHKWPVDFGVMIETPASVLLADELAQLARFFSIGTNDLTQYVLAAERGSARLEDFLDTFEPSVLRAVRTIADIGRRRSVPVSVCGEFGADIAAIPLLVGLGIGKISASPSSIPAIKDALSRVDAAHVRDEVESIVDTAHDAREVKERLSRIRKP